MAAPLYHITTAAAWAAARDAGAYRGDTLDSEGFVHCSTGEQLPRVAAARFAGRRDLLVLRLNPDATGAPVRYENLEGGDELFPHVYGALPVSAVTGVAPLVAGADGEMPLPERFDAPRGWRRPTGHGGATPPAAPVWFDVMSPDVAAAARFYGAVLGWQVETLPPDAGGYTTFTLRGRRVAAVAPAPPGVTPHWNTYVSTDDVDATARLVRDAGGTVVVEPMRVMTAGRVAAFEDRAGAAFSVWEPGETAGVDLHDQPGAVCWTELVTRDEDGAIGFYGAVFGWEAQHREDAAGHTVWLSRGRLVAGIRRMDASIPATVPANWLVHIAVDDLDAALGRLREAGGRVLRQGPAVPGSRRFTVVADDRGAPFALARWGT